MAIIFLILSQILQKYFFFYQSYKNVYRREVESMPFIFSSTLIYLLMIVICAWSSSNNQNLILYKTYDTQHIHPIQP